MEIDMDDDMEDTFEGAFEDEQVEIDFDYEYDASKFFDFCRQESVSESQEAESWFGSATSYPPSPFVQKFDLGGVASVENVNTSPKPKEAMTDPAAALSDTDMDTNVSEIDGHCRGLTFYNHMTEDIRHPKVKHAKKSLPKGSTLMKTTASQLAKQNQREGKPSSRLLERSQKSWEKPAFGGQASKRQKLEGGHLPKAVDTKQQTNFIHKVSKMPVDGSITQTKLKLTIPRQPDLETAHRAQKTRIFRPKNGTESGQQVQSTTSMFKARPLNRKILEAPSLPLPKKSTPRLPEFQEFHLKTSERAMQHSSSLLQPNKSDKVAVNSKASSHIQSGKTDTRSNSVDTSKQDGSEAIHKFKARPLNKKIFSSKGDIGVPRNTKREATKTMEFNFSTEKRLQFHPPIELFDKLSLASELQAQPKLPRGTCLPSKVSKENTANSFQQQHKVKEKSNRFGGKQFQCGVDGEINEIGSRANMRSVDIR